jgi:aminopeptidase
MLTDFRERLTAFATVIARVGLNLQPGQKLLVAEPYELQGVARSAEVIVDAVRAITGAEIEVQWGDGGRLRQMVERRQWRDLARLTNANAQRMQEYIAGGNAVLFLLGSQPRLMTGLRMDDLAEFRHIAWQHFGPVAQQLTAGSTNWTIAPAPSPAWANFVFADLPSEDRLAALWSAVFSSCRCDAGVTPDGSVAAWQDHLRVLAQQREQLNGRRLRYIRYQGNGTDLKIALPPEHRWCTAQLTTPRGLAFVANLPTEEIFTAPMRESANGTMTGAKPINYGGSVIDGIELGFSAGRVVRAHARKGDELLQRLLDTDDGARYLGEVAIVPAIDAGLFGAAAADRNRFTIDRLFHHPLLDENSANHVALGDAYSFCASSAEPSLNRSLIHFDLPIDAAATVER